MQRDRGHPQGRRALWSLAFAAGVADESGVTGALAVGVHVEGIGSMIPGEPNDGVFGQPRRDRSRARDPIPVDLYDTVTLVSVAELAGDWWHALDRLFGKEPPCGPAGRRVSGVGGTASRRSRC
jgi:hypothetical protein